MSHLRTGRLILLGVVVCLLCLRSGRAADFTVVDTGQMNCYDNSGYEIECPEHTEAYFGQDAQHLGHQPAYIDNGDGTVSDITTGLMWVRTPDLVDKSTWDEAVAGAATCTVGGYSDWRLPTIKELYSLIRFDGWTGIDASSSNPYIDTAYFEFAYGQTASGERFIDAQYCSSTEYVSTTMTGNHTVFGVNFADGRIKGYPTATPDGSEKRFYIRYVRDNPRYGVNDLADNGDGTVADRSTGLMWSRDDSGVGMTWEDALAWVEARNLEGYLGYSDWRLPNAKELQSIVDYSRSPDTTGTAALDPVFDVTQIVNEGGQVDYPYFWCSTTHLEGITSRKGDHATYVAFGRALGWMDVPPGSGNYRLLDVHGAGSQRSDPKTGSSDDYPYGHGPQGDVIRIDNFVRLVRDDSCSADGASSAADGCGSEGDVPPMILRPSGRRR